MLAQSVAEYVLPLPAFEFGNLPTADSGSTTTRLSRLADHAAALARARAALKDQNDRFEQLYQEAERGGTEPQELEDAAIVVLDAEQRAAGILRPQIEQLERNIARKHPPTDFARSLRRSAEESLDVARSWLELYQNLRIRLFKLASDRRAVAGETGSPVMADANEMEEYLRRIAGG